MTRSSLIKTGIATAVAVAVWWTGAYQPLVDLLAHRKPKAEKAIAVAPPSVTVSRAAPADFVETVLVTGSLIPREEVLVAPEVEGLRILELRVDQGDRVKKGDILAVLETTALDAQLAQNAANMERATAAIAQANSQIVEVEARLTEAEAQLERAKPLSEQGYLSGSTLDQRTAAKRSLQALLVSAQGGLKAAEAEKLQLEAARRELEWRRSRTDVRAPVDGIISRRSAHIGAIATAVGIAAGDPMFRIVQNGEIELNAEVEESQIRKVEPGQSVSITVADGNNVTGKVRLVSPEVDNTTRLGRVRVFIGADERLRVGTFASGLIETAREHGLAVPVSAVSTSAGQSSVLVLDGDVVRERSIRTGLASGGLVEVMSGLTDGDRVITRAGTFLKDGDVVRPVETDTRAVSEAK
ncbi:MAG: efflux RND transporter periplasmic adaptor subunit [Hyphomicrobium sp.]|nr:efflux RND transporter periplasmic adaptor subunit [Hyphomicrobium sp.]